MSAAIARSALLYIRDYIRVTIDRAALTMERSSEDLRFDVCSALPDVWLVTMGSGVLP
jgi:hypothetical protein